ncbi:hypothetical protein [Ferrovibrio xuzhouensis]|uniref:Uncharacterized protein n=1 Tax=Ferrovibrio xuzhouensis TaxID=1576914 RepID=A0ABV7VAA9_9PROT
MTTSPHIPTHSGALLAPQLNGPSVIGSTLPCVRYGEHGWSLEPAPDQTDMDGLSMPRMKRLANAMGIRENFDRWYVRWQEVQKDEDIQEKFSKILGY